MNEWFKIINIVLYIVTLLTFVFTKDIYYGIFAIIFLISWRMDVFDG